MPETTALDARKVPVAADAIDFSLVKARLQQLRQFQKETMVRGEDYDRFPGTNKDTLLKPGAEKLLMGFGYAVGDIQYTQDVVDAHASAEKVGEEESLTPGHAEFEVKVTLIHPRTGVVVGTGTGSCSSAEKKYVLGRTATKGGTEEPRVVFADQLNTLRKMAKKRALVDATLTATMASGLFTQDLEDMEPGGAPATQNGAESQPPGPACPQNGCDGTLVPRKRKSDGKPFYGCSRYPRCKHAQDNDPNASPPIHKDAAAEIESEPDPAEAQAGDPRAEAPAEADEQPELPATDEALPTELSLGMDKAEALALCERLAADMRGSGIKDLKVPMERAELGVVVSWFNRQAAAYRAFLAENGE